MNQIIINRFKSLAWRAGAMGAALLIDFAIANLSEFNLNPEVVVVLGLVLGEVSKYLNTNKGAL